MTQAEAAKQTKYFREGVCVSIWCYAGDGDWAITVKQDGHCRFYALDPLKRRVLLLRQHLLGSSDDLRLMSDKCEYPEDEISFPSPEPAWACIAAIAEAVQYVQSKTSDPDWHEVPSDLFQVHP